MPFLFPFSCNITLNSNLGIGLCKLFYFFLSVILYFIIYIWAACHLGEYKSTLNWEGQEWMGMDSLMVWAELCDMNTRKCFQQKEIIIIFIVLLCGSSLGLYNFKLGIWNSSLSSSLSSTSCVIASLCETYARLNLY